MENRRLVNKIGDLKRDTENVLDELIETIEDLENQLEISEDRIKELKDELSEYQNK